MCVVFYNGLPQGAAWFSMVDNAAIRVSGARNGVDGSGRERSNALQTERGPLQIGIVAEGYLWGLNRKITR